MTGWLMCTRFHVDEADAEMVVVEHDGPMVALVLDDGERVVFDRVELEQALRQPEAVRRAA